MRYLAISYIIWNFITFGMMGIDKYKAEHKKWRISEFTLLFAAFAMGAIGAYAGSQAFRHKTKKEKFKILLPLAILFNMVIYYFIIRKWLS